MCTGYRISKENKEELEFMWWDGGTRFHQIYIYIDKYGDLWYKNEEYRIKSEDCSVPDTEEARARFDIIPDIFMIIETTEHLEHFMARKRFLFSWDNIIVSALNIFEAKSIINQPSNPATQPNIAI